MYVKKIRKREQNAIILLILILFFLFIEVLIDLIS